MHRTPTVGNCCQDSSSADTRTKRKIPACCISRSVRLGARRVRRGPRYFGCTSNLDCVGTRNEGLVEWRELVELLVRFGTPERSSRTRNRRSACTPQFVDHFLLQFGALCIDPTDVLPHDDRRSPSKSNFSVRRWPWSASGPQIRPCPPAHDTPKGHVRASTDVYRNRECKECISASVLLLCL